MMIAKVIQFGTSFITPHSCVLQSKRNASYGIYLTFHVNIVFARFFASTYLPTLSVPGLITRTDPKHRGISPRALTHVFQEVSARIETAFSVNITYMEIYNEKIFDLLVDPAVNATKVRKGEVVVGALVSLARFSRRH